jgi:hypothetical protein
MQALVAAKHSFKFVGNTCVYIQILRLLRFLFVVSFSAIKSVSVFG